MLNSKTKFDDSKEKEPVVGDRVSIGARKIAKSIAHDVWDKYSDEFGYKSEKQARNERVSVYDPDCMIYFFGQFDSVNQLEFVNKVLQTTNFKFKGEILEWIKEYFSWYEKGDKETKV